MVAYRKFCTILFAGLTHRKYFFLFFFFNILSAGGPLNYRRYLLSELRDAASPWCFLFRALCSVLQRLLARGSGQGSCKAQSGCLPQTIQRWGSFLL